MNKIIKEDKCNFSVVIPCYNLGDLLLKAVDSVFAQTLDNIEIIVVDDYSKDLETQKILEDVEKKVRVIRLKENGGVSVARNMGVERAKFEYILCLDADDTIEPTYLEKAKNIFDANDEVGIVSCGVQNFGGNDSRYLPVDFIDIRDALVNSPVHTASCFRKSMHDIAGGYDKNLRGYEDWDHWLRIMKQSCIVRVIPEYLFNYYIRPNSKVNISNQNSFKLVSGIIDNHRELYEKNFDYVIAKKHEELARKNNIDRARMQKKKSKFRFVRLESFDDVIRLIVKAKKKVFSKKWI